MWLSGQPRGRATRALFLADGANARSDGGPEDWVIACRSVSQSSSSSWLLGMARAWGRRGEERASGLDAEGRWLDDDQSCRDGCFPDGGETQNLLLTIGAAIAVAELGVSASTQAGAIAIFVFLGTLAPGIPLAISLLMRERGTAILVEVRSWMVRENETIVVVLCLVFAAKLLGDALLGSGN